MMIMVMIVGDPPTRVGAAPRRSRPAGSSRRRPGYWAEGEGDSDTNQSSSNNNIY